MPAHVLVVEDETAIADVIVYALSSEGLRVTRVALLQAAAQRLNHETVDALVLDIGLPDGNGLEWLKQLRRERALPVLLLSARNEEIDRVLGLELGADDYLGKPFSPRELAARVKALLRRRQITAPSAPPLPAAEPLLVHDPLRAQIRCRQQALSLTHFEYRLLAHLLAHPEQVFSRAQLMAAVDAPEASLERSLDTHIKSLRAKLRAQAPEHEVLVTHRGLGYSLRLPPP